MEKGKRELKLNKPEKEGGGGGKYINTPENLPPSLVNFFLRNSHKGNWTKLNGISLKKKVCDFYFGKPCFFFIFYCRAIKALT